MKSKSLEAFFREWADAPTPEARDHAAARLLEAARGAEQEAEWLGEEDEQLSWLWNLPWEEGTKLSTEEAILRFTEREVEQEDLPDSGMEALQENPYAHFLPMDAPLSKTGFPDGERRRQRVERLFQQMEGESCFELDDQGGDHVE